MFLPDLAPGAMVASAIAPALLLLWLVVAADSRPEPPWVVWIAVGLGALAAIPTGSGDAIGIVVLALSPVVDVGTIVYAVRLARRIAHHQKAWLETKRLPPAHWRGLWAQCLVGVGSSFAALPLIFAGNWVTHIAGWALLVCAVGITRRCGKYLSEAAVHRHRSAIAPPV